MNFTVYPLADLYQELGENETQAILSKFSCHLNKDVESYLRNRAILSDKQFLAKTFLMFDENKRLLAYFTLANKIAACYPTHLPRNYRDRIKRFSVMREDHFEFSCILIAQLAKNDAVQDNPVRGVDILTASIKIVKHVHSYVGGKTVYLECENRPKLCDFYQSNGFRLFGERETSEGEKLLQYIRWLD
jgi:hypothetical protein